MCIVCGVPRIWNTSIESHRAAVRQAILDTTATLVAESGVTAASMSQIAERAGIGRATLYKYFPDVETILVAWHQDRVAEHITQLTELQAGTGEPWQRLEAVIIAMRRSPDVEASTMAVTSRRSFTMMRPCGAPNSSWPTCSADS